MRTSVPLPHAVPQPRRLSLVRAGWLLLAALWVGVWLASVPLYAQMLTVVCPDPFKASCKTTQLTAAEVQTLQQLGVSLAGYARYSAVVQVATSLVFFGAGVLIFWRKSHDWYGLLVSLFLIIFGAGGALAVFTEALDWRFPQLAPLLELPGWIMFPGLGLFFTTFPDGRFVPRWSRVIPVLWLVQRAIWPLLPPLVLTAEVVLVYGSTLAVQVYRYRTTTVAAHRQQTKWVLFGFALIVGAFVVQLLLIALVPAYASVAGILEGSWMAIVTIVLPTTLCIAILRYRLWEIDVILSRALVYGVLTAFVIGTYILVVAYFGTLLRIGDTLLPSLIATGLVAVLFQPLRERVQRAVNRVIFGERDDPYAVMSRLARRLGSILAPEAALPAIVYSIQDALKLPYVAIALDQDHALRVVAAAGDARPAPLALPLTYQGETIGRLLLAPRAGDDGFGRADRRLLDDLARQAGVVVHAVRLTRDLERSNAALQASRERIITLREEERRRLRRDLHDGLGPALASLTFKLDAARNLLRRDPDGADTLLGSVTPTVHAAIADIRRLVYDLRPPVLDQLGLGAALRELAVQQAGAVGITVEVPAELPPLPAAVEVAAYRIVQEALTNVIKHAAARRCTIRLTLEPAALVIEVADDGHGMPAAAAAGVGLHAMRERAEELGGTWSIQAGSGGGTVVQARLPRGVGHEADHGADC